MADGLSGGAQHKQGKKIKGEQNSLFYFIFFGFYIFIYLLKKTFKKVYLFIFLVRECMQAGAGAKGERKYQAGSELSMEPAVGLDLKTLRSWPELKSRVESLIK